jgi:hypothetical protein
MTYITELTAQIMHELLPATVVTDADRAVIAANKDFLLSLEDTLVATFYDSLFAHPPTAAVFQDGERPAREQTLRDWWQRTVAAPLDDKYFAWMTLVGVVHIRRKVQNPMMLSMFHLVADTVHTQALQQLGAEKAEELRLAFSHLASTVSSIISEAYTKGYIAALQDLAGLDPKLTERMLQIEVGKLEAEARAALS